MADRGLVTKEKCDADRRGAYVVVTERGRQEIEAAAPGHVAAVRRLFIDRLTPAQLDAVGDAAEIVLAAFDDSSRGKARRIYEWEGADAVSNDHREPLRILVFSASLRAESLNTRLARLVAEAIERHGATVDLGSMRDFDTPSYDGDVED